MRRSLYDIASVLVGERVLASQELKRRSAKNSVEEICRYFRLDPSRWVDESEVDAGQLEQMLKPAGYLGRPVRLEGAWWRHTRSAMLGTMRDGTTIALIPGWFSGYSFFDYARGRRVRVRVATAKAITPEARAYIRPLPQRKLSSRDVFHFLASLVGRGEFLVFVALSLLAVAVSLVFPWAWSFAIGTLLPAGADPLLGGFFALLLGMAVGEALLGFCKGMLRYRFRLGMENDFQSAIMARLLYLPFSFFRKYSTGEIESQTASLGRVASLTEELVAGGGFSLLVSLLCFGQVRWYAGPLLPAAILVTGVEVVMAVCASLAYVRTGEELEKRNTQTGVFQSALFEGMEKLKEGGAEKRAFARWASLYKSAREPSFHQPFFLVYNAVLVRLVGLAGMLLVSVLAVVHEVPEGEFVAFLAVGGMVSSAFSSLGDAVVDVARIRTCLHLGRPVLDSEPELVQGKRPVERLDGRIEVNHLSFRYPGQHGDILKDCSFTIEAGQYCALVGRTGCGKTTLLRLLLGFLEPDEGAVYLDGRDLHTLDPTSYRRHVGTVLQEGRLFAGDIRSNLTIAKPTATDEEIRKACEIAGIWDDIARMPMGLRTFVGAGTEGLSGGQRQRILIARALIGRPSMLVLDEAMTALDYLTQKRVSFALEAERCTRLIVSHRLSTIRQCDRILVLDQGRIVEQGTFDELMAKNGAFVRLTHAADASPLA